MNTLEGSGGKPGHLTHLAGDVLVPKTDPRIRFRGALDTLEAEVLEAQALAPPWYRAALGEVLASLRAIMAAAVRGGEPGVTTLFGLSLDEIHAQTHDVKKHFGVDHPLPSADMRPLALRLNTLRARTREVEIAALDAYPPGAIPALLNRLSSALYWLYCKAAVDGGGLAG